MLRRAREQLAHEPVRRGDHGARIGGANHASALVALTNLAEPQDAPAIARVIERAADSRLRSVAFITAATAVEMATQRDPGLLDALRRGVDNQDWTAGDRADALRILALAAPDEAEPKARELLNSRDLELQTRAAWVLAENDLAENRAQLMELVASWPRAPYPAFEVRRALEEDASDA